VINQSEMIDKTSVYDKSSVNNKKKSIAYFPNFLSLSHTPTHIYTE